MPRWVPEKKWLGGEVFIIGGGKSLESFDWDLLKSELTIGCNDAYTRGAEICKLCLFGDYKWWEHHENSLRDYKGVVFTNVPRLNKSKIPWLWFITRESMGIHKNALGWNFSTGASAVNLAVLLGATKIYLLGFDMQILSGRANWHDNVLDKPDEGVYDKFLSGFASVAKDLREKFPEIEVFNITDKSVLEEFPKIGVKEFWAQRKK